MLPFDRATFGRKWDYDDKCYECFALIPNPKEERCWIMIYKEGGFDEIGVGKDFDLNGCAFWGDDYRDLMGEITDLYYAVGFENMAQGELIWHRDKSKDDTKSVVSPPSPITISEQKKKVKVKVHKKTAAAKRGEKK